MIQVSWRDRLRTGALALVAFSLAHNLTFLTTYGGSYAAALARTGHGPGWTAAVALVAVLAATLALAGAIRLLQLSHLARELAAGGIRVGSAGLRDLTRQGLRSWLEILSCALMLFVAAENLEHLAVGLPAPGLGMLGVDSQHPALVIFAAVAFAAALVDALYRWRRDVLRARIEAARSRWPRTALSAPRPDIPWIERRHQAIAGFGIAGRAPPLRASR
jgi:hypothetical protein